MTWTANKCGVKWWQRCATLLSRSWARRTHFVSLLNARSCCCRLNSWTPHGTDNSTCWAKHRTCLPWSEHRHLRVEEARVVKCLRCPVRPEFLYCSPCSFGAQWMRGTFFLFIQLCVFASVGLLRSLGKTVDDFDGIFFIAWCFLTHLSSILRSNLALKFF